MNPERWGQFDLVDSTQFGDVLGSLWQIGIIGVPTLKVLAVPLHTEFAKTIGDRYLDCGMHAVGGPRGIVDTHALHFSSCMEVDIRPIHGNDRLSLNSCIGVLSLADVKENNPKWPKQWGMDGDIREVHRIEQRIAPGNRPNWRMILASPESVIGTIWRSTPLEVWKEIVEKL